MVHCLCQLLLNSLIHQVYPKIKFLPGIFENSAPVNTFLLICEWVLEKYYPNGNCEVGKFEFESWSPWGSSSGIVPKITAVNS